MLRFQTTSPARHSTPQRGQSGRTRAELRPRARPLAACLQSGGQTGVSRKTMRTLQKKTSLRSHAEPTLDPNGQVLGLRHPTQSGSRLPDSVRRQEMWSSKTRDTIEQCEPNRRPNAQHHTHQPHDDHAVRARRKNGPRAPASDAAAAHRVIAAACDPRDEQQSAVRCTTWQPAGPFYKLPRPAGGHTHCVQTSGKTAPTPSL